VATTVGPIFFTLFVWWFSTGAVLYAVGSPRRNLQNLILASSAAAGFALYGLSVSSADTSVSAAFISFTCALVIWAWHEMTFLTGLITGPRTTPLKGREGAISNKPAPLGPSIETVIYHEVAIVLTIVLAAALTHDGANQTGFWTLVILWVMRLSAKFNLYLGVPNLTEQFLPDHLAYLKGYFCRRSMNLLFPVSVTASTIVTILLFKASVEPAASAFETTSLTLLATLMALAVIEHWFMVVPLPSAELWSWGLASREPIPARDAGGPPARRSDH
jgi:putative photosynthetic complex assembly protein 2